MLKVVSFQKRNSFWINNAALSTFNHPFPLPGSDRPEKLIDAVFIEIRSAPQLSRLIEESIYRLIGQQMLKWNKKNGKLNLGKLN